MTKERKTHAKGTFQRMDDLISEPNEKVRCHDDYQMVKDNTDNAGCAICRAREADDFRNGKTGVRKS
jgi:hypothetical protein